MIKIEVVGEPQTREITSRKTGELLRFTEQDAYAHFPHRKYPERITVPLEKGSSGYSEGMYTISADSLYVDRFGKLAISLRLQKPVENQQRRAASA